MRSLPKGLVLCLLVCLQVYAFAGGTVAGTVTDPTGAVVPGAAVTLTVPGSFFQARILTDHDGRYQFNDVPFAQFVLRDEATGFGAAEYTNTLRSAAPVLVDIHLKLAKQEQEVSVKNDVTIIDTSSTLRLLDFDEVEKWPAEPPDRAMSAVVESVPGVVPEENGRFHARGAELQPQYVLDGIPIRNMLGGTFNTGADTENWSTAEFIPGNIPAESGEKQAPSLNLNT